MWCRPLVGPPTKAMSCGVVVQAIQVATDQSIAIAYVDQGYTGERRKGSGDRA